MEEKILVRKNRRAKIKKIKKLRKKSLSHVHTLIGKIKEKHLLNHKLYPHWKDVKHFNQIGYNVRVSNYLSLLLGYSCCCYLPWKVLCLIVG